MRSMHWRWKRNRKRRQERSAHSRVDAKCALPKVLLSLPGEGISSQGTWPCFCHSPYYFFFCLPFWLRLLVSCSWMVFFFNVMTCAGQNSLAFRVWVLQEAYFPAFPRIYEPVAHWNFYLNENLAKYYPQSNIQSSVHIVDCLVIVLWCFGLILRA